MKKPSESKPRSKDKDQDPDLNDEANSFILKKKIQNKILKGMIEKLNSQSEKEIKD